MNFVIWLTLMRTQSQPLTRLPDESSAALIICSMNKLLLMFIYLNLHEALFSIISKNYTSKHLYLFYLEDQGHMRKNVYLFPFFMRNTFIFILLLLLFLLLRLSFNVPSYFLLFFYLFVIFHCLFLSERGSSGQKASR